MPEIGVMRNDLYSAVFLRKLPCHFHAIVGRCIVNDEDPHIIDALIQHTCYATAQEATVLVAGYGDIHGGHVVTFAATVLNASRGRLHS